MLATASGLWVVGLGWSEGTGQLQGVGDRSMRADIIGPALGQLRGGALVVGQGS